MRNTVGIVCGVGLMLCCLASNGQRTAFGFGFAKGSSAFDVRYGGNGLQNDRLAVEFGGDRFLEVQAIEVVGVVDSEGSYAANLTAARERAESVADWIEEKYSWMFVDGRLLIAVAVEQGVGAMRSVRVEVTRRAAVPAVSGGGDLGFAPQAMAPKRSVSTEQGVLVLPSSRKVYTQPFISEPVVWDEELPLVAIKTNLLFDLATAVNLEVEMPIGRRWSVLVGGVFPAWNYDNHYCVRILETSLEGRFWFPKPTERLMGHFVGVYGHWVADYDLQWDRRGVMGSGFGFGFTYGYAHSLSRDFGLEYSLGVGLMNIRNKSYDVTADYQFKQLREQSQGWHLFPTRLKVSLVWRIGGQKAVQK